jgi:hypothetical protein
VRDMHVGAKVFQIWRMRALSLVPRMHGRLDAPRAPSVSQLQETRVEAALDPGQQHGERGHLCTTSGRGTGGGGGGESCCST